jgi:hypothetical protein
MCPVLWDMTNVSAYSFPLHSGNISHSANTKMRIFQVRVFCQMCGLLGVVDLWLGGVSYSGFNQRNGYLEEQRLTQETLYPSLTFMIIAIVLRWQHDRMVGSLFFSLPSWRGNHRVGNISKRAGLISTGFQSNSDPIHFDRVRATRALRPISCLIQCHKTTLQILSCPMTLSIRLIFVSCNIKTEQEHCWCACWAVAV